MTTLNKVLTILLFSISLTSIAQTMRYFEFTFQPITYPDWRDTSFIAATSDQAIIDSILLDLNSPITQRHFIIGPIAAGNGGFNHNSKHWFLWHHIPNQWHLAEYSIELCDGRPYSDVDLDTTYWLHNANYYCPWGSKPAKEVYLSGVNEIVGLDNILVFPNPTHQTLNIIYDNIYKNLFIQLIDIYGNIVLESTLNHNKQLDTSDLSNGLYILTIQNGKSKQFKKVIIE